MGRGRCREGGEIVAAFKCRHEPSTGVARRDGDELIRNPGVIRLDEHDLRERIAAMCVEARGNEDELGPEFLECRQDMRRKGKAELARARHRRKRHVEDIPDAALARCTGTGYSGI